MPGLRNSLRSTNRAASATGLTGLDQTSASFSWGAWMRRDYRHTVGVWVWAHANSGATPTQGIAVVLVDDSQLRFRVMTASPANAASPVGIVQFDQWHHFGIRANGTNVTWYLDGAPIAYSAFTAAPTVGGTRTTQIGPSLSATAGFQSLDMFDVQVFPALALSDGDMRAMADPRNIVSGCKQRLFFQRNWRAQGAGAVTVFDESGNGNDLTTSAVTEEADAISEPNTRRILYGRRVFGYVPSGTAFTQALAASLTPSATVSRQTRDTLAASVTPAATVTKRTARSLTASLTASATVAGIKTALKSLSASLTPAGALTKRTSRTLSASVTAAGVVRKQTRRALAASVSMTASVIGALLGAGAAGLGLITATLTWVARYAASLTATARHDADLTAQSRHDADLTAVPRHDADLTYLTEE